MPGSQEANLTSPILFNPLHPIYILHTLLYTFPLALTRRIHLKIKASKVGDHFLYSHYLND